MKKRQEIPMKILTRITIEMMKLLSYPQAILTLKPKSKSKPILNQEDHSFILIMDRFL